MEMWEGIGMMWNVALNFMGSHLIRQVFCVSDKYWRSSLPLPQIFQVVNGLQQLRHKSHSLLESFKKLCLISSREFISTNCKQIIFLKTDHANNINKQNTTFVSLWSSFSKLEALDYITSTSKACWMLSLCLPEWEKLLLLLIEEVLVSQICSPKRQSSGSNVSAHSRQMPSWHEVSRTLQTDPLK